MNDKKFYIRYIIQLISPRYRNHLDGRIELRESTYLSDKHLDFINRCCLLFPNLPYYKQLDLRNILMSYLSKYHFNEAGFGMGIYDNHISNTETEYIGNVN